MNNSEPTSLMENMVILTSVILVISLAYVIPIYYGLKWAKQSKKSGRSLLWFALHPLFGWITVGMMRWGIIDVRGNTLVKPISGKVACDICGNFNSINSSFCPKCSAQIQKPICPNCGQNKTQFVGNVGNNIGLGFLLIALAGIPVNAINGSVSSDGNLTILAAIYLVIAGVMCVVGCIYLFKPFFRSTKQIKCLSCGIVSPMTSIVEFESISNEGSRQTLKTNFEQENTNFYSNKQWNFTLSYPKNWTIFRENEPAAKGWTIAVIFTGEETKKGISAVTISAREGNLIAGGMRLQTATIQGNVEYMELLELSKTPSEFIEDSKASLRNMFPEISFLSEEEGKLADMPTATLVYLRDGGRIKEKNITVFNKTISYQIICESPTEKFIAAETTLNGIMNSFRVGE